MKCCRIIDTPDGTAQCPNDATVVVEDMPYCSGHQPQRRPPLEPREDLDIEYITAEECWVRLKISESNFRRLVKRGMPHVMVGRLQRFLWTDVVEWLVAKGAA